MSMRKIRAAFIHIAHTNPKTRPVLLPLLQKEAAWESLPKGWTEDSVKKFWSSLTGDAEHKVTSCISDMEGKVDDPGAFCASLKDKIEGSTEWRGGGKEASDESMLRARTIRLAHENPDLRPFLLPILKEAKEKYPWEDCIEDQLDYYGDRETAEKVCGKIKAVSQGLGSHAK